VLLTGETFITLTHDLFSSALYHPLEHVPNLVRGIDIFQIIITEIIMDGERLILPSSLVIVAHYDWGFTVLVIAQKGDWHTFLSACERMF
jgi:hypothetical protein